MYKNYALKMINILFCDILFSKIILCEHSMVIFSILIEALIQCVCQQIYLEIKCRGYAMEREISAKIAAMTRDLHTCTHWYSVSRRMVFFVCGYGGILFHALATEAWLVCRKVGNITTKLSHATVEVLMNLGEEPLVLGRNCLPLNNPTTG